MGSAGKSGSKIRACLAETDAITQGPESGERLTTGAIPDGAGVYPQIHRPSIGYHSRAIVTVWLPREHTFATSSRDCASRRWPVVAHDGGL